MFIRDSKYQLVFDKFNRTVWNWIYGNITAAASPLTLRPVRETLYEDVKIPTPRRPSFYQSLIKTSCMDISPTAIRVHGEGWCYASHYWITSPA